MKQVIQLDQDGYFVGHTVADKSPLEPGVYLMPAGTIDAPDPNIPDGQRGKWTGDNWIYEEIPPEKPGQPYPSWTYNKETNTYIPPVPQPEPEYIWDEDDQQWYAPLDNARRLASLSRANFKLALLDMGELDNVKYFIEQTNDQRIIIMWEDSSTFNRMNPDLLLLASEMGYTDAQLDELFGIN